MKSLVGFSSSTVKFNVLIVAITLQFGIDILDKHCKVTDIAENQSIKKFVISRVKTRLPYIIGDRNLLLNKKNSLELVEKKARFDILHPLSQLTKVHKNIFGPAAQGLFNLIKQAQPYKSISATWDTLKGVSACNITGRETHKNLKIFCVPFGTGNYDI